MSNTLTFKEQQVLLEARDPKLTYKTKTKGKDAAKVIDKVILELEGNQSGVMSKLTSRYHRLDKAVKLMAEKKLELNAKIKDTVEGLFDAEDVLYTRIVETVSMTITLSKAEKAETKQPKIVVDYKAIVQALSEMSDELAEKVKEVTMLYTVSVPPEDTPVALRVKSKLEEGVMVDGWKKFKSLLTKSVKSLTSWALKYDKKILAIKKMAGLT